MPKLTVKTLENLRPKMGQFETAADRGLRVRVYPSGRKAFVYRYKDPARRQRVLSLGEWPGITLAEARRLLAEARALREQGGDPAGQAAEQKAKHREGYRERAGAPTVADILGEYMARHVGPNCRPATVTEFRRLIERNLKPACGAMKAGALTRSAVVAALDGIADTATPSIADHAGRVLAHAFNFAVRRGRLEANSCQALPRYAKDKPRDRILTPGEIRTLWQTLEAPKGVSAPVALALKLLLATAQRRRSLAVAQWGEFTADRWEIPSAHAKTGVAHVVPLSPLAQALVERLREITGLTRWVLPNPYLTGPINERALTRALRRLRTGDYTLHDLRRTGASLMAAAGVTRHVIGRVLGHSDGSMTAIYDRYEYQAEKRRALETLARKLGEITGQPEAARVVAIR